jgi:hypothetical protein
MNEWGIFWICLFTYWAIKYITECVTYDKRRAIKELAEEKHAEKIEKLSKLTKEDLINALNDLEEEESEDE